MGLINNHQKILREIIQQRTGRFTGSCSGQMSGIVLNSRAKTSFPHHFHVKIGPFRNSLGLQQLILALKISHLLFHLRKNIFRCLHHFFFGNHVMRSRENGHMAQLSLHLTGQYIDFCDPVHLIAEEFDPVSFASGISRKHFQHVSAHPEGATLKVHLISCILNIDELMNHLVPVLFHPRAQGNNHFFIIDGTSQTINAGHRRHNDHVIPLRKRRRRRMAQLINLIVDGRVLLNVSVCGRDIGLGLVVVVVGDKILHRVLREELLKLTVELCCKGFIVGNNEGGLL